MNGKLSISKRENNIKKIYFFTKGTIEKVDVEVVYYPTEDMWSVVITKSKQGMAFCKDRDMLMNCLIDYEDSEEWEDIEIIAGVPTPEGVKCPKTEK